MSPALFAADPEIPAQAWVIIGGLLSSTLLTRLVTPVVYELLAPEVALEPGASVEPAPEELAHRAAA